MKRVINLKENGSLKIVQYSTITCLMMIALFGCGNKIEPETEIIQETEMIQEKNLINEQENIGGYINPYEAFKDYPPFSEQYMLYYINSGILDLPNFSENLNVFEKAVATQENNQIYVYESSLGKDEVYKKASKRGAFIYTGSIKNEQPDGFGSVDYYTTMDYWGFDHEVYEKVYRGFIKKGKCDVFGMSYLQLLENSDRSKVEGIVEDSYDGAYQECTELYFNPVSYIGEYKNGEKCGWGIYFEYPEVHSTNYISEQFSMEDVKIFAGDFKKNSATGVGKIYLHEYLLYDGEMKNGKKEGAGELYYQNTNELAFRGTFKDDEVVDGTLYSPEGEIIRSGKWENGLCGITDFNEVYYQYSDIKERDVKEIFGQEYEDSQFLQWVVRDGVLKEQENERKEENIKDGSVLDSEYIVPNSDKEFLTYEDIQSLSNEELRLARNEIYARHGRLFQTEDLNEYFSSKSWYKGYLLADEFDDNVLNKFEKANLDLIKSAEDGKTASQECERLVGGMYEEVSDTFKLSISVYSDPIQEGNITNIGCMEIIRDGESEWSELLYDGSEKLRIMDMNGNDIGTLQIIGNESIETILSGKVWRLSRIETYFEN